MRHTILKQARQNNHETGYLTSEEGAFTLLSAFRKVEKMSTWTLHLNAAIGSLVVTFGLWLVWGEAPVMILAAVALVLGVLLSWGSSSLAAAWAGTTALLGLESFAFAVVTMIQGKLADREPTEQEMVSILTAMLFGLFSSIFWLTFSYGIFKKFVRATPDAPFEDRTMRRGRESG
ncbi:MAG: hypothetical protein H0W13_05715 [Nitrospirales bacterium]|nr:hypothetical protein [Nitrospirales bacterium]